MISKNPLNPNSSASVTFELVEWLDSRGVTDRWARIADLEDHNALRMLSAGWVFLENDREIMIAPHIGIEEPFNETQVCGVMTIPKVAILCRMKWPTN